MFLLLDACVIIDAHLFGVWSNLIKAARIVVPSIVIHDEAQFFEEEEGQVPSEINLTKLVTAGIIQEATATAGEISEVLAYFDSGIQEGLDPGEVEALAILLRESTEEMSFCTADRRAVEAVAMLGLSEQGISMESMLDQAGLHKDLPRRCSEQRFRQHLSDGTTLRLHGKGMPYD